VRKFTGLPLVGPTSPRLPPLRLSTSSIPCFSLSCAPPVAIARFHFATGGDASGPSGCRCERRCRRRVEVASSGSARSGVTATTPPHRGRHRRSRRRAPSRLHLRRSSLSPSPRRQAGPPGGCSARRQREAGASSAAPGGQGHQTAGRVPRA
jgi:hypothetical protein